MRKRQLKYKQLQALLVAVVLEDLKIKMNKAINRMPIKINNQIKIKVQLNKTLFKLS